MSDVHNNRARGRYELETEAGPAVAGYREEDGIVAFVHTEVPEEVEGHGIASRLIEGALADVRARGLKIAPRCAFVAAYVERHPEAQDLVA
jgi:uncharacterized protein